MLRAVVCDYRTPWDLETFLESWGQHAPDTAKLTIALVAPREADRMVAVNACGEHGHDLIEFADNVGYGRAVNESLAKFGDGDVVACFNADVQVRAGAVDACVGAVLARPDWGVLGPRQVDQDGRLTHAGIFGTTRAPQHRAWRHFDGPEFGDVRDDAVMVSGSALFARRAVWQALADCPIYREAWPDAAGPLLETELFYEETWLCRHVLGHDLRVAYFGPATLVHGWHRSVRANHVNTAPLMRRSRQKFRDTCIAHGLDHE